MQEQANETSVTSLDLASFDTGFGKHDYEEFGEISDGTYQVNVEQVELKKSSNGNPMMNWKLCILAPKYENRIIYKNSVITEKTLRFIKQDLYTCGLLLKKISELPDHLEELLDLKLEIRVKTRTTNGDSQKNIYFNKRLDLANETVDEEVPF